MTQTGSCFALITDPIFGGPPGPGSLGGASALVLEDGLLILAAGFTVALVLVLWARYGRRGRSPGSTGPAMALSFEHGGGHRRRRRTPRVRNPTRAETGGLPPLRMDGPPPPSS